MPLSVLVTAREPSSLLFKSMGTASTDVLLLAIVLPSVEL